MMDVCDSGHLMETLDLSIIIVSYNTREMTRECLCSVFSLRGKLRIEVFVVDNCSADGSREMLERDFPQVILIKNDENFGFAKANNQAIPLARGKFILLLNSDTIVLGNVLEESVKYLESNPDVGAMGCRVLNTDRTLQRTCSGYPSPRRLFLMTTGLDRIFNKLDNYLLRGWNRDYERDVEVISGCYLMTTCEVIRDVGLLDDSFFFFGEETDWCARALNNGWKLRFFPGGEIVHHGGGSVKKLNHRRDVMLTDATIRLNKKHFGSFSALITYLVLAQFNISRMIYWGAVKLLSGNKSNKYEHFRDVVRDTIIKSPKVL